MVYKVGDKVIVDGEKWEILTVYGGGTGYMVEDPDGAIRKVTAEQVSEAVEDEDEGGDEMEGEGVGEGGDEGDE